MEKFEKVKSLGRGAQGSVILVRRKADNSKFVIKRIFVDDQPEADQTDVMNEIRVLAMLKHPNIVGYYGSFVEDGVLNVVMEYADNGTMFQHIQRARQPFTESEIVHFAAQLVMSLQHLHDKKILHRDLKTKNIFVTKKGQVKLGDFGLSKMLGSATSFAQSAVGTPYYLSPELCEGKPYNRKSDVWALGCVLYELATFRHAFDATNLPALVMTIVQGKYSPVEGVYSQELRELIAMCLEKHPERRAGVEDLLQVPIIAQRVQELTAETAESIRRMPSQKPFFEAGHVETAMSAARRGAGGVGGAPRGSDEGGASTSSILSEVEEEQQFERLMMRMRQSIPIGDRVHMRIPYFKCFQGADLVDYLVGVLGLESRADAVAAGQRWMDAGVFYHVTRSELFFDGGGLYRFKEDEVGSILNMKVQWEGPVREAMQVKIDFRARLDALVRFFTTDGGQLLDYEGLALSEAFKDYTVASTELQCFQLGQLSFSEKITFFINLYNALVVHGFVVIGPPTNLYQRLFFYNHTCYSIGGYMYSLSDIEHGILRGNQKPHLSYRRVFGTTDVRIHNAVVVWDPRIHFALVRGTRSCPPLKVYTHESLDQQLHEAARDFITQRVEVTQLAGKSMVQVVLPGLFEWYKEDFGPGDAALLRWVAQYLPPPKSKELLEAVQGECFVIKYLAFDWALNKKHRPPAPPTRQMSKMAVGGGGVPPRPGSAPFPPAAVPLPSVGVPGGLPFMPPPPMDAPTRPGHNKTSSMSSSLASP